MIRLSIKLDKRDYCVCVCAHDSLCVCLCTHSSVFVCGLFGVCVCVCLPRIPPNVRDIVYCTGVSLMDEDVWEFIWMKFHSSTAISEKKVLLEALTCSDNAFLLNRCLEDHTIKHCTIPDNITLHYAKLCYTIP